MAENFLVSPLEATTYFTQTIHDQFYPQTSVLFFAAANGQVDIVLIRAVVIGAIVYGLIYLIVSIAHPEKLAVDHKKILIDGDLDFLKEAPFWNQEMKKIKFPMDVQKSYELSKLIP